MRHECGRGRVRSTLGVIMEIIKCNSATILVTGREAAYAEPTFVFRTSAWEADVLPLNYARVLQYFQRVISSDACGVLHVSGKVLHVARS